jgi:hypothetical protein
MMPNLAIQEQFLGLTKAMYSVDNETLNRGRRRSLNWACPILGQPVAKVDDRGDPMK